ncbi:MFS transporter, partial [Burkholderia contaminans]|nr:MFS transporter [Burkholderia contaminans]
MLYLAYGILGGLGLGAGYITPVSTIIKWFPDKRGLATGLAIMGFGFASLLTSPIAQHLIAGVGIVETFYILGASYFIIMLLASQFIKRPNEQELAILSSSGKEKTA